MQDDYRVYDVRDAHEHAPTFDARGFRLRIGRMSAGRTGRAVAPGSFGAFFLVVAVMIPVSGAALSAISVATTCMALLVGGALSAWAARTLLSEAEVVCEGGRLWARRSWGGGETDAWDLSIIDGFVAHVRRPADREAARWSPDFAAWSVSARARDRTLDLGLFLRPEQAERVAQDLKQALAEVRVREASQRGFRG